MNKTSQRFTLQSQQPLNQEKQQKQSAQQRLIKSSDIDALLKKILHQKDPQQEIKFTEEEIKCVCLAVREHFLAQSSLLRLIAPIKIVGDIHGQFPDLIKIFKKNGFPSEQQQTRYLFLGDYVDRGKQSIECVMLLFAYMLKYPQCVFMLRGNHESAQVNKLYGFWDQCKRRYSLKVWKYFVDCFNCMPVCALIQDRILCMHGGLSPQLTKVKKIELLHRPTQIPPSGLLCDLLWSDPVQDKKGWNDNNERGISKLFGPDVLQKFLQVNDLDLICRAHQIVQQGYEFFGKKQLVTIFSAPNYCGQFENSGAVMNVGKELVCSFNVLKSEIHGKIEDGKKKKTVPKYIN